MDGCMHKYASSNDPDLHAFLKSAYLLTHECHASGVQQGQNLHKTRHCHMWSGRYTDLKEQERLDNARCTCNRTPAWGWCFIKMGKLTLEA